MSRLIDADAMKQHYPIMENDFGMVFNEGLHKKLDLEPTVEAIPLDKVEQILEKYKLRIPPTVYYDLLADVRNYEVNE